MSKLINTKITPLTAEYADKEKYSNEPSNIIITKGELYKLLRDGRVVKVVQVNEGE